jgi:hypothetical protein
VTLYSSRPPLLSAAWPHVEADSNMPAMSVADVKKLFRVILSPMSLVVNIFAIDD